LLILPDLILVFLLSKRTTQRSDLRIKEDIAGILKNYGKRIADPFTRATLKENTIKINQFLCGVRHPAHFPQDKKRSTGSLPGKPTVNRPGRLQLA